MKQTLLMTALVSLLLLSYADINANEKTVPVATKKLQATFNKYCTDCHYEKKQKGKIRLDNFSSLSKLRKLEMLNKVEEQIYLEHMPPEDEDVQPSLKERQEILTSITSAFKELDIKSSFRAKLTKYSYANYVDHDKLFSGEFKDLKGFTYDRQWLISEYIFDATFNRLFNSHPHKTVDGKRRYVSGVPMRGVTNPFLLPSHSGVRYYANEAITGGQLLTMLGNAEKFSIYMVDQREGNKSRNRKSKKPNNKSKVVGVEGFDFRPFINDLQLVCRFVAPVCP